MSSLAAEGELLIYHGAPGDLLLTAYCAPPLRTSGDHFVVFIGGMYDALLSRRYLAPLQAQLNARRLTLVNPLLSSSGSAWGYHSLATDCRDLDRLLAFLRTHRPAASFTLVGSSTGCQDIVALMRTSAHAAAIAAVVLQAPVSDREYLTVSNPSIVDALAAAERMVAEGRGEEFMPRATLDVPITAARLRAIAARGGEDDMFSSDFTDAELAALLGHVRVPALLVFSTQDQYYPKGLDVERLAARLTAAFPQGRRVRLADNHFVDANPDAFVAAVTDLLASIGFAPR